MTGFCLSHGSTEYRRVADCQVINDTDGRTNNILLKTTIGRWLYDRMIARRHGGLTLLCSSTRSSTISSVLRERLKACSSSMSSAGRLPEGKTCRVSPIQYAVPYTVPRQKPTASQHVFISSQATSWIKTGQNDSQNSSDLDKPQAI